MILKTTYAGELKIDWKDIQEIHVKGLTYSGAFKLARVIAKGISDSKEINASGFVLGTFGSSRRTHPERCY